jgi:hypothetical protein
MKQEELKSTLGKIQPREELIQSTLDKIHAQQALKQVSARRSNPFSAAYNRGMRLAAAACAFVLVFSMGFAVAKLGNTAPVDSTDPAVIDMNAMLDTENVQNDNLRTAAYSLIPEEEWLVVRGRIRSVRFLELTEENKAMGAIASVELGITVSAIEGRSDEFSRKSISPAITATILVYDTESLNLLVDTASPELLIQLIPTEGDGWDIHDFSVAD